MRISQKLLSYGEYKKENEGKYLIKGGQSFLQATHRLYLMHIRIRIHIPVKISRTITEFFGCTRIQIKQNNIKKTIKWP